MKIAFKKYENLKSLNRIYEESEVPLSGSFVRDDRSGGTRRRREGLEQIQVYLPHSITLAGIITSNSGDRKSRTRRFILPVFLTPRTSTGISYDIFPRNSQRHYKRFRYHRYDST